MIKVLAYKNAASSGDTYTVTEQDGVLTIGVRGEINERQVDQQIAVTMDAYKGHVLEVVLLDALAKDAIALRTVYDKVTPDSLVFNQAYNNNVLLAKIVIPPDDEDIVVALTRDAEQVIGIQAEFLDRTRTVTGDLWDKSPYYQKVFTKYKVKASLIQKVDVYNSVSYIEAQVDVLTRALLDILPAGHPLYAYLKEADQKSSLTAEAPEKILHKLYGDKGAFRAKQAKYRQDKEAAGIADAPPVLPPPPTEEEITAAAMAHFDYFVKKHLDAWANTRQYDGIDSLVLYANDHEPNQIWRTEGTRGVQMKSLTWAKCMQIMAAVLSGEREIPTEEGLLAELPALTWEDGDGE
jgi:hypothetical protein